MSRSDYYERIESKRERLYNRAEKLKARASAEFDKADLREERSGIPFGQPILVGHHSERRHRNIIKRADQAMRRGIDASNAAKHAEARADGLGKHGISSDAPDAIELLKKKLRKLEAKQQYMKILNSVHRAYLKDPNTPKLKPLNDCERKIVVDYTPAYSWEPHPFPPYALQNNNANIKRARDRIAQLEQQNSAPAREPIKGDGWKVWEDRDENRVFIAHDSKPSAEVRQTLKRAGFRWSRYAGAWSRLLNDAAWRNAEYLAQNGKLD